MRRLVFSFLAILVTALGVHWQSYSQPAAEAYVDRDGVLRWKGTEAEVSLFGVNYTTPFAYSYRAHKRLGISLKKAIDLDVAHMVRLDLDAFRVHVWDREISDGDGNLLKNEHLDLFDYLLSRLAERGIKTILTPIAWWGNGWPEPDRVTKGFSQNYSKLELITNGKAREAQRNYLRQFVQHINPYRKKSCLDDPSIIAIEIINEPNHPSDDRATTDYINEMAAVLRDAGLTKPIFYNISENWSDRQANAVTRGNVEGVSFQWYPTDLVHGKMLTGNFLMNVSRYPIPSESVAGYEKKAKMVYEFDAADVAGAYMYPAMARSYREAGMQFAAMFSYDPVQIAWSNTEYPTHYLNLLYTPSKAVSLMIAANAFRELPRGKSYGDYPENSCFGDFRVSYEENLSEMNSGTSFLYSSSTGSQPKDARSLRRVGGVGSSPVVHYDGTGAYFLDKLEEGIWRLEVYPDVLSLRDPFESTSMSREVARLFWRERRIEVKLPDLGAAYALWSEDGSGRTSPAGAEHLIRPGAYLVSAASVPEKVLKKHFVKKRFLEGLYVPPPARPELYVVNRSRPSMLESTAPPFAFLIAGRDSISSATLFVRRPGWRVFSRHPLKDIGRFTYALVDTPRALQSGRVEYCVAVESGGTTLTFPGGVRATPGTWDFSASNLWTMKILARGEPIVLLDVLRDRRELVFPHYSPSLRYALDYKNGPTGEDASVSINVRFSGLAGLPFGFQASVGESLAAFADLLTRYRTVVVSARSHDTSGTIGIHFVMSDGKSFASKVKISTEWQECRVPLSAFHGGPALLLPDPYPRFLTSLWNGSRPGPAGTPDLRMLERVQITVDPLDARPSGDARETGFELSSIVLVP
jgi:hypothetical protein